MRRSKLKHRLKLYTTFEAARQLGLPIWRLMKAIQLGRIDVILLDADAGVVRILQSEVETYHQRMI